MTSNKVLQLGAAVLIAASGALVSAQTQLLPSAPTRQFGGTIAPVYEGWWDNADGSKTALFGYYSRNSQEEVEVAGHSLDVLHERSGASVTRKLPTLKLYKIGVKLDMTGRTAADAKTEVLAHERPERRAEMPAPDLSPLEMRTIAVVQNDLPVVERPFAAQAAEQEKEQGKDDENDQREDGAGHAKRGLDHQGRQRTGQHRPKHQRKSADAERDINHHDDDVRGAQPLVSPCPFDHRAYRLEADPAADL